METGDLGGTKKYILFFLATLYIIGEHIQWIMFYPSWLRWHLSDFGFPFMCIFYTRLLKFNISAKRSILLGGALGVALESVQFILKIGDPIDVAVFIIATAIGVAIIESKRPSG